MGSMLVAGKIPDTVYEKHENVSRSTRFGMVA